MTHGGMAVDPVHKSLHQDAKNLSHRTGRFPIYIFLAWMGLIIVTGQIAYTGWTNATSGIALSVTGLLVGIGIVRYGRSRIHALSVISLISACHGLIFIIRPSYAVVFQESSNIFTKQAFDDSFLLAQAIATLGYLALCVGYRIIPGKQNSAITQLTAVPIPRSQWPAYSALLWLTVAFGFGLYGIYILSVGPSYWYTSISGGRSEASRQAIEGFSAYLYSGNQFAFGALIFLALQFGATRNRRNLTLVGFLLLVSSYPAFASGSRSVFVPLFVALLYVTYIVNPSILKLRKFVIWGPLAYVLLFIAPRLWREQSLEDYTLEETIRGAFSFESAIDDFLGGLDTAMVDAFAIQVAAQNGGTLEHSLGVSYLSLFLGIVPRSLWPGKPVPVDSYLNSVLFPRTYAQGTGFSFGLYSEPFLAYGLIGVVIVCLLMGMTVAKIASSCITAYRLDYAFVLVIVTSYVFPIFRGSVSFDIQRLLMPLIPVLIVALLCRLYYGRKPVRPDAQ